MSGRVAPDRIEGTISFDDPGDECGAAATWSARPAFVGRSSQGMPAVARLSPDRRRISRLRLAWVRRCPGGIGLDPPENVIGLDQANPARLGPRGGFAGRRRATRLRANAEIEIVNERFAGRASPSSLAAIFEATVALGPTHCARPRVRLDLRWSRAASRLLDGP